jgi:probable blue pigment (indigoidine) exporter
MRAVAALRGPRLNSLAPGLLAAVAFGFSDVLTKLAFAGGAGVLTLLTARSVLGVVVILPWLRLAPPAVPHSARARLVALALGVLYAGNVGALFIAITLIPVPIAVLTYFAYPLLTGLVGAAIGLEKLDMRGFAAALMAFLGLGLMVGVQPVPLAGTGIAWALLSALSRAILLLVTRAELAGADPRLTTWYSLVASAAVLVVVQVATRNWMPPVTVPGTVGFSGVCVLGTIAMLALFASAHRIGAFRTALVLNLEPLVTAVLSAVVLDQVMTPLQVLGGVVMIGALCAFQLWR